MIFNDRKHAGLLLADKLLKYKNENPVILALPRGGVPVAAEVAKALNAPLEVLLVRKIGVPNQPELAAGAVCEDDEPIWNERIMQHLGLSPAQFTRSISAEREKIYNQKLMFRQGKSFPSFKKKTVIVVDDGLATGATMFAAIKHLKNQGVAKVVAAVPVAAEPTSEKLRSKVDELVVIQDRKDLNSIGQWYSDFSQVSNEEVVSLLVPQATDILIPLDEVTLKGDLSVFPSMRALVIFAHGSGSSRKSPRNRRVAQALNAQGIGTLLFDLLTEEEAQDRKNVFDIDLLSKRLAETTEWLRRQKEFEKTPLGYFGASTGAGAALRAATKLNIDQQVYAIVSRGGRPDLAGEALSKVKMPTLLIVGGNDFGVIELNQQAHANLPNAELILVDGATHLFEEPGALEEVSQLAARWFIEKLPAVD